MDVTITLKYKCNGCKRTQRVDEFNTAEICTQCLDNMLLDEGIRKEILDQALTAINILLGGGVVDPTDLEELLSNLVVWGSNPPSSRRKRSKEKKVSP